MRYSRKCELCTKRIVQIQNRAALRRERKTKERETRERSVT